MPIYCRNGKYEIRLQVRGVKYYRQIPEAQNDFQAKVAEATLLKEIYEGRYGKEGREIGSTDFTKFCKEVYEPSIKEHLRNWKHEFYKVDALCRYFRGKRLKDISRIMVEKYRRDRLRSLTYRGTNPKPVTVKAEILTLSCIFNMAIENELIGLNPCRKIKWKKGSTESHRERVLAYEEEAKLMPELRGETKAAVILSLNTGLRRMGLLRSKVEGVDLKNRTLEYVAKGGKVKKVPLNQKALEVVMGLMAQPGDGYLFSVRTGHNLSAQGGAFKRALDRAGIKDFTFHDLRHTFATRVREFTDPYTVRDLVAHSDLRQTGEYITVPMEDMRRAVDALCEAKVLKFEKKTG